MNMIRSEIWRLCERLCEKERLMLIDLVIRGNNRMRIVEVFIDGAEPVNVDKCRVFSKELGAVIDEREIIKSGYRLDVSSPGVDRPLKFFNQYPKHIGKQIEVTYLENLDKRTIKGKLIRAEENKIAVASGKEEFHIEFNNITKAKIIISF